MQAIIDFNENDETNIKLIKMFYDIKNKSDAVKKALSIVGTNLKKKIK